MGCMNPLRYAVIGNPIAHSLSPLIHEMFSRQTGIALAYERLKAPLSDDGTLFREKVMQFFAEGGKGLNVTAPFKSFALSFSACAAENAFQAGAANTLTPLSGGWRADNTDGIGFIRDLYRQWGRSAEKARILIFGAGGAVAGILGELLAQKPTEICLCNRTEDKALALKRRFPDSGEKITILSLPQLLLREPFDLIVNGIGVRAVDQGGIPWQIPAVSDNTFFYDMVYSSAETPFVAWVRTQGMRHACDGLGMLIEQAAESFRIWHGVLPETAELHMSTFIEFLRAPTNKEK